MAVRGWIARRWGMHVYVMGTFRVEVAGTPVEPRHWRLRKARTLVAMLALSPDQRMHRDQVIERLWPDQDAKAGAHSLHQVLYVARRALGDGEGHDLLTIQQEEVVLCTDCAVGVDALDFERTAAAALATGDEARLRQAPSLYRSDLLTDHPYLDWISERRASLKAIDHALRIRLAEHLAGRGSTGEALL